MKATGEGSQQQLTITTRGGKKPIKTITQTVNGTVLGAEVTDLNSNSLPEIYVDVQSADSGSDGELVAYSVINGNELSPIDLQELTGAPAKASGGLRQICYKLKNGETSWILRPSGKVLQF